VLSVLGCSGVSPSRPWGCAGSLNSQGVLEAWGAGGDTGSRAQGVYSAVLRAGRPWDGQAGGSCICCWAAWRAQGKQRR
jgi:hypothetical protein